MRPCSATLQTFLLSKAPCAVADLYTLMLLGGQTYYWTSYDQPLTLDGVTYLNVGPALTRKQWGIKNTFDVPSLEIQLISTGSDFNGSNIMKLAHDGLFDGAYLEMNRVIMPSPGDTSLGAPLVFGGRVSNLEITATGIKINVKGDNVVLQQYLPRNIYRYTCLHLLYDAGCTLDRNAFTVTGNVVQAGSNQIFLNWNGLAPTDPTQFTLGYIAFTSGVNTGTIRSILVGSSTGVQLTYPLYNAPSVGDVFSATYGCDRTFPTCSGFFNNAANFRGFPYIPAAETGL